MAARSPRSSPGSRTSSSRGRCRRRSDLPQCGSATASPTRRSSTCSCEFASRSVSRSSAHGRALPPSARRATSTPGAGTSAMSAIACSPRSRPCPASSRGPPRRTSSRSTSPPPADRARTTSRKPRPSICFSDASRRTGSKASSSASRSARSRRTVASSTCSAGACPRPRPGRAPSPTEMGKPVVVAYDVGTSGVKAVVVDASGHVLGSRVRTYGLSTPRADHVEQNIEAMVAELGMASREVIDGVGVDPSDVAAVALTAQMFSVVPVDAAGIPLRPMLSWLDQRSSLEAARIQRAAGPDDGYASFDAVLTAKDIVPRICWVETHEPDIARRTARYLDCKEAVVARLTGTAAIDPTGASAFRLVDPATGDWDPERCELADVPIARLPPILAATDVVGRLTREAAAAPGLRPGTPVATGAGAIGVGDVHLSLGTAVYFGILCDTHVEDPARRLGPLRHIAPPGWLLWLEIATGGAALSWLDRQIAGLGGPAERDHAAIDASVEAVADEMEDLQFVPWLTGERVPLFDDAARAAFVGLALHHGRAHLIRAVMEGLASQISWAYEYGLAYGIEPGTIRAVGGGSIGGVWTRLIADALDRPLEIVADPQDAAARGAAACALVAAGLADDVRTAVPPRIERSVAPDPEGATQARARLTTFRRLYPALREAVA